MNESTTGEYPVINIVGDRVALGPLRRDLLQTYQRWINDFSALLTLGAVSPGPTTMEQEERWYESQAAGEVRFTVYERATGRPIGSAALHGIDYRNRSAVFGIFIGEAEARGRATEQRPRGSCSITPLPPSACTA